MINSNRYQPQAYFEERVLEPKHSSCKHGRLHTKAPLPNAWEKRCGFLSSDRAHGNQCFKNEALIWVSFWRALKIQPFNSKGWFKSKTSMQEFKKIKYITRIKLLHELYGTCFQYNVIQELRFDHLTLLLVVTMSYACGFLWSVDYNILRTSSDVF